MPEPSEGVGARQWATSQMMLRSSKGLPNDHEIEATLMEWVAPFAQLPSVDLESRAVPMWVPGSAVVDVEVAEEPSAPVVSICPSCKAKYAESVKFCSECGTETVAAEASDLVAQLEESVRILLHKVRRLEGASSEASKTAFSWASVPDNEKWTLTWGVFGRTILINIGIFIALAVVMGSLGFIAGS